MSVKISAAVWQHSEQKGNGLILLLKLADNADDGGYCWPGIEYLAEKTRTSTQTIIRRTKELEASREIFVVHNRRHGNKYVVRVGLTDAEFIATLRKHFSFDDETITNILIHNTCGSSHVPHVVHENYQHDGNSELPHVLHESSLTVKEPSIESSGATAPKSHPSSNLPTPSQEMFSAVAELCQIDLTLITKKDRGKINTVSKRLRENGKKPQHLSQFERYWYAADWRGKKGQAPNPHDILSNWGKAKTWLGNGGRHAGQERDSSRPGALTETEAGKRKAEAEQAAIVRATLVARTAGQSRAGNSPGGSPV